MNLKKKRRKILLTKWWVWFTICIMFLALVQFLFSIPAPCKWLDAVWEPGDLITFVGTITLGYVAWQQSKMANDMANQANSTPNQANEFSKALLKIEQSRYKLELRPFFMIANWKAYKMDLIAIQLLPDKLYFQVGDCEQSGEVLCLSFVAINTTQSYISIEYKTAHCRNGTNWMHATASQQNEKITLPQGASAEIVFYAKPEFFEQQTANLISMEFYIENRFTERYLQTFDMMIMVLTERCTHAPGQWFCALNTQNYIVRPFVKNGEGEYELSPLESTKLHEAVKE